MRQMPFSLYEYIRQGWKLVTCRPSVQMLLGLRQQVCTLEGRAQGQIEEDDADGRGHAVHEGDAAGDLGQSLGDGVLLAEDVDVAEVAEERVGEDIQQQAGGSCDDHLGQIAGVCLSSSRSLNTL